MIDDDLNKCSQGVTIADRMDREMDGKSSRGIESPKKKKK